MDAPDERTFSDKISDAVAKFGGSWKFILTGFAIIIIWVIINTLAILDVLAWDKYPFILLNLFLSLIAAFQAPFIMMSQRRCEIKQDMIYRSLFREIKELVETDLAMEYEINQHTRMLADELAEVKSKIDALGKKELSIMPEM